MDCEWAAWSQKRAMKCLMLLLHKSQQVSEMWEELEINPDKTAVCGGHSMM